MSTLADAVKVDLARHGLDLDVAAIDKLLAGAGVSPVASSGVPVRLRVRKVLVTGTKTFRDALAGGSGGDGAAGGDGTGRAGALISAPINLDWSPTDGVNGVGSEVNLRGKSSVLHFAMWTLTGRSHLQNDVLGWVDEVRAEFTIDGVPIYVEFVMSDGAPVGKVEQGIPAGRTTLGTFTGHAEFEALMGSVMLARLRLDVISVFSNGAETEHAWPTYAAALTVHADKLDPIVGNVQELKTRILQMFVGTGWAAVGAQVANALNARTFEERRVADQVSATTNVSAAALTTAEDRYTVAKAALNQFDPDEPDVDTVFALASTATERAQEAHDLSLQLMSARNAASEVHDHLRAEKLRRQAASEDAVARRLFNGMAPSACPRCSKKVTAEKYAAEATEHECSLCAGDLYVDVPDEEPGHDGDVATQKAAEDNGARVIPEEDDDDASVDPLDALRQAAADADAVVADLTSEYQDAEGRRSSAESEVQRGRATLDSAHARLQAELELARAEASLDTMRQSVIQPPATPTVDEELEVLKSADQLVRTWVRGDQDPLLSTVSDEIANLAQRFGANNITSVALKGNGNMDVYKGGAKSGYSGLTNGEKLRVKLAAAIALIKLGHDHGVGRHPGLLFIDSPAAEEVPEADLKVMLEAMTAVAKETDLQVVVATTHGPTLSSVLPASSLLVAIGTDFVW